MIWLKIVATAVIGLSFLWHTFILNARVAEEDGVSAYVFLEVLSFVGGALAISAIWL